MKSKNIDTSTMIIAAITKYMPGPPDTSWILNASMVEKDGSNFRNVTVNGVDCIGYEVAENDIECLIYPVTENIIVTFSCTPLNGDEDWDLTKGAIFASIQPGE